jgi:hypothetical protein
MANIELRTRLKSPGVVTPLSRAFAAGATEFHELHITFTFIGQFSDDGFDTSCTKIASDPVGISRTWAYHPHFSDRHQSADEKCMLVVITLASAMKLGHYIVLISLQITSIMVKLEN